jgi:hypothetical protein
LGRLAAKEAFELQESDVKRAREAAERSQAFAEQLAGSNAMMAKTQAQSLELAAKQFVAFRSAVHSGMQPLLYESNPTVTGDFVTFRITNKGRMAAEISEGWCAGGVYVRGGSADVVTLMNPNGERGDILRRAKIVPDQQEQFQFPALVSMPHFFIANNPFLGTVKQPLSWLVACDLPYSDELDDIKSPPPHDLRFCYEIQPQSGARIPVMCPLDQVLPAIQKLGGRVSGK